jgi:hypothetical protein
MQRPRPDPQPVPVLGARGPGRREADEQRDGEREAERADAHGADQHTGASSRPLGAQSSQARVSVRLARPAPAGARLEIGAGAGAGADPGPPQGAPGPAEEGPMAGRVPTAGDRWLRVGAGALLALLAGAVVYAVAIGVANAPRIGV